MNRISRLIILFILVTALAGVVAAAQNTSDTLSPTNFQIAEDGSRFSFDEAPVFDDGMPAYGSAFITQGYIYEAGTLDGTNGVLEDGSPEFPDAVIGTWTCFGYMIGDGMYTESGAWVVSTQMYEFDEDHGGDMIITQGMEWADIGVEGVRAISGGTGEFATARGEQKQILLGFSEATQGVVLDVTIEAVIQ